MTELIWDGKYKDGKKVSPVRIELPFQTIETVNEKRKTGLQTDMFALAAASRSRESGWKNRLIWGDKKYVLPSLLPDLLEKKAVEHDIRFFELTSLGVEAKVSNRQNHELTLTLENFIVPPGEVPDDVQGKISHRSQWVDYWAVDWNYRDDTFHNEWQSYRTKQDPKLELKVYRLYEEAGVYQVVVRV